MSAKNPAVCLAITNDVKMVKKYMKGKTYYLIYINSFKCAEVQAYENRNSQRQMVKLT